VLLGWINIKEMNGVHGILVRPSESVAFSTGSPAACVRTACTAIRNGVNVAGRKRSIELKFFRVRTARLGSDGVCML